MADYSRKLNSTTVTLTQGDITGENVDAIVNAANSTLMGGGGVDGAIHRAGGPTILEECKVIRQMQGQCAPGNAVITGAGNMKAKFVVHTVGPIWRGGNANEAETLANAYKNSLARALENEVKTIAFPSISTGAYGYPVELAAKVALDAVADHCASGGELEEIRFVLFDARTYDAYKAALEKAGT